jgi:prophage tail gpP-like protein
MPFEIVTLTVGGLALRPQTISITASMEEAARSFEAKLKDQRFTRAQLLDLLAGSPEVTIRAAASDGIETQPGPMGGDLMLTGHVEKRQARLASDEGEIAASGRSKTADSVDGSHEHKTGEFKDQDAKAILSDLVKPMRLEVESDVEHKPRKIVRARPGETPFKVAERLARAEGFSITDTPEGKIKLAKASTRRHAGGIYPGGTTPPCIDLSATHDDSKRASEVKVKAQAPDGYAATALEIEESATDPAIERRRLRVITPPEAVTRDEARKRAKWHRDRAAGKGVTASATVVGWRDAGGQLWTPGWLIAVEVPDVGLVQDMMIESVSYKQSGGDDSQHTLAELSLVDPRAYGGKGGKAAQSGKSWGLDKTGGDDS